MRNYIYTHVTEICLSALLMLLVAMSGYGIRSQAQLSTRVTANAIRCAETAMETEALRESVDLKDARILALIEGMQSAENMHELELDKRLMELVKRLDQRCDVLEKLISRLDGG